MFSTLNLFFFISPPIFDIHIGPTKFEFELANSTLGLKAKAHFILNVQILNLWLMIKEHLPFYHDLSWYLNLLFLYTFQDLFWSLWLNNFLLSLNFFNGQNRKFIHVHHVNFTTTLTLLFAKFIMPSTTCSKWVMLTQF